MSLWDTHCHLADDAFAGDRGEVAQRAAAAGVSTVVVVAADPVAWDRAGELAAAGGVGSLPLDLRHAYGLHPHEARLAAPVLWSDLRARLEARSTVALGEIGLDHHYDHSSRPDQRAAFALQLQMAADHGLPVILHEREAAAEVLDVLRGTGLPPRGGAWHCFSGGPALAAEALALGLHLGFGGLLTFRRGTEAIREAARLCPLDRLLLETDAPYLAPVPHRGQRNEPALVAAVLDFLAQWRGMEPADLADATSRSAEVLFALRPAPPRPGPGT